MGFLPVILMGAYHCSTRKKKQKKTKQNRFSFQTKKSRFLFSTRKKKQKWSIELLSFFLIKNHFHVKWNKKTFCFDLKISFFVYDWSIDAGQNHTNSQFYTNPLSNNQKQKPSQKNGFVQKNDFEARLIRKKSKTIFVKKKCFFKPKFFLSHLEIENTFQFFLAPQSRSQASPLAPPKSVQECTA